MTTAARAVTVEPVELDEAGCQRLLAGGMIGRIVCTTSTSPAAQPVTFLLAGEELVVRTGGGNKLAAAGPATVVASQVDEIDKGTHAGWALLETYEVLAPRCLTELAGRMAAPWAPIRTPHTIPLPLQRPTGRKLLPVTSALAEAEA